MKGGYQLNKPPDEISIHSIVQAVDGPVYATRCSSEKKSSECEREKFCIIRDTMVDIHSQLIDFLGDISLKDFQSKMKN